MAVGETQAEAERPLIEDPRVRVLRSSEIDLSAVPALPSGPLPRHWVVVVEHVDPETEAALPQESDPEAECSAWVRQLYLRMAIDRDSLVSGVLESLACPVCQNQIRVELPPPRDTPDPEHAQCPDCAAHLRRTKGTIDWEPVPSPQCQLCVFCGAKADSHEHVIPKWISKRLAINDQLAPEDAFLVGITRRRQPVSLASYRARIFCVGCNTHFKHLEDEVIPLLVPMAKGVSVALNRDSQALLALWANKTAIALVTANAELRQAIPATHRRAVRQGHIADDTWVGFFSWTGGPVLSVGRGDIRDKAGVAEGRESYMATFAFSKIAFSVMGLSEPIRPDEVIDLEPFPVQQFWPTKAQLLHWPAPSSADNRLLPVLLNSVPVRTLS